MHRKCATHFSSCSSINAELVDGRRVFCRINNQRDSLGGCSTELPKLAIADHGTLDFVSGLIGRRRVPGSVLLDFDVALCHSLTEFDGFANAPVPTCPLVLAAVAPPDAPPALGLDPPLPLFWALLDKHEAAKITGASTASFCE